MTSEPERWNHNIHYHPLVLAAVPDHADRALDEGCGEGMVARELRRRVPHVVAIDRDEQSVGPAGSDHGVDYVLADFLNHPFRAGSFDLVVFVLRCIGRPSVLRAPTMFAPAGPFGPELSVMGVLSERWSAVGRPLGWPWSTDVVPLACPVSAGRAG